MWYAYTMEYYSAIKENYEISRCGGLNGNSPRELMYLNAHSLVVVLTVLRKALLLYLKCS